MSERYVLRPPHAESTRRARSPASFSGRTKRHTWRRRPRAGPGRGRRGRASRSRGPRSSGSTQTCWSCTALARPRGRLGLEEDLAVLAPDPAPALLDLHPRAPLEERRVAGVARRSRPPRGTPSAAAGTSRSRSSCVAARSPLSPGAGGSSSTYTGWPGRSSSGSGSRLRASPPRARSRPAPRRRSSAARRPRPGPRSRPSRAPDGTTFAPTWQSATTRAVLLQRGEAAEPAPRDVLEEHALDRILLAEGEDRSQVRRAIEPRHGADDTPASPRRPRPTPVTSLPRRADPRPSRAGRLRRGRASSPAIRCGRSTSPRPSWRTSSR